MQVAPLRRSQAQSVAGFVTHFPHISQPLQISCFRGDRWTDIKSQQLLQSSETSLPKSLQSPFYVFKIHSSCSLGKARIHAHKQAVSYCQYPSSGLLYLTIRTTAPSNWLSRRQWLSLSIFRPVLLRAKMCHNQH